jgi:quinol monooxygenase YgiN
MSLVVVEAQIVVDAARRDELVAESAPVQQATRDEEPGCLVYCFAADPTLADRIQVYELWESEDALHEHFAHPNYTRMLQLLASGGLVAAESRKHRVDATAEIYGPDGAPSGHFA